ncbi:MAG: amino acid ABC transporter permease [Firmicutes bacterium]|nr:amino acid ABC transporter permease [Bacillota bacterium]
MDEHTWTVIVEAFPRLLGYFVRVTVPLTILSFMLALVIAVIVALIQYANVKGLRQICRFYIWVVRGTPLLVQLYLIFYGLPSLGIVINAFPCAVLVFGFNEAAYMAESVRGALESVPKGQVEAGHCVGMNYLQIMWHIVLPQAFRVAFPALSNSLISMTKETSLASGITVMEMFRQAQVINGRVYQSLALYSEVALIYLAFCTLLTALQHWGERKLGSYGQTTHQPGVFARLFGAGKRGAA